MRSVIGKALILGLAVAATSVAGCSSSDKPSSSGKTTGNTGDIGLQLQIGATTVNSVHYQINNGTNNYEGDLDVSSASHLLAVIGGIQAGSNYVLTLTATGTNGTPCSGQSAPFTVVANSTVIVGIQLLCRLANDAGSVKIEGTVAECANFGSVSAAVPNGNQIQITTTTLPANPNPPVSFSWMGGSPGGLSSTTAANPVYTCNGTENQVDLDVTLSQAGAAVCNKTFHLILNCPVTGGGTGGAGGTAGTGGAGGATGGTAGTGGAGGATGGTAGTGGATGGTAGAGGATGGTAGAGGTGGGVCRDGDCSMCTIDEGYAGNVTDGHPDPCSVLTGTAAGGPGAGTLKSALCQETLDCYRQTQCDFNGTYICYCGTEIDQGTCNSSTTIANPGPCKAQMERSLEIPANSPGSVALNRVADETYAGGSAGVISAFEAGSCRGVCRPYTCQ
jgi:hypothetical protein